MDDGLRVESDALWHNGLEMRFDENVCVEEDPETNPSAWLRVNSG